MLVPINNDFYSKGMSQTGVYFIFMSWVFL